MLQEISLDFEPLQVYLKVISNFYTKRQFFVVVMVLVISIVIGFSVNALAEKFIIPSWIKSNAKWWSEGKIGDSDFIQGIQYLINQGIAKVSATNMSNSKATVIPAWIKTNAGWWANGTITDQDFVLAIQFLIQNGIIQLQSQLNLPHAPVSMISAENLDRCYYEIAHQYKFIGDKVMGVYTEPFVRYCTILYKNPEIYNYNGSDKLQKVNDFLYYHEVEAQKAKETKSVEPTLSILDIKESSFGKYVLEYKICAGSTRLRDYTPITIFSDEEVIKTTLGNEITPNTCTMQTLSIKADDKDTIKVKFSKAEP